MAESPPKPPRTLKVVERELQAEKKFITSMLNIIAENELYIKKTQKKIDKDRYGVRGGRSVDLEELAMMKGHTMPSHIKNLEKAEEKVKALAVELSRLKGEEKPEATSNPCGYRSVMKKAGSTKDVAPKRSVSQHLGATLDGSKQSVGNGKKRKATDDAKEDACTKKRALVNIVGASASLKSRAALKRKRDIHDGDGNKSPGKRRQPAKKQSKAQPSRPVNESVTPATKPKTGVQKQTSTAAAAEGEEASRKRKAEKDLAASPSFVNDVDEISSLDDEGARPAKKVKLVQPKGLTNHAMACFANAVFHLVNEALKDHNLDDLLGNIGDMQPGEDFGLPDLEDYDLRKAHNIDGPKGCQKIARKVRKAITKLAQKGMKAKTSIAKHLRYLLGQLRDKHRGKLEMFEWPFIVIQVLAYGDPDDTVRQSLNGDNMCDAAEFFQALMNALNEDQETNDPVALKELFNIKSETKTSCSTQVCTEPTPCAEENNSMYHVLQVPLTLGDPKASKRASIEDMFEASLASKIDLQCPSGGDHIAKTSIVDMPANLVLSLNRNSYPEDGKTIKVKTAVDLAADQYELGGHRYTLEAIVQHHGEAADDLQAHYTAFRKFSASWYELDDESAVGPGADISDNNDGQCAMLLLKKMPEMSISTA